MVDFIGYIDLQSKNEVRIVVLTKGEMFQKKISLSDSDKEKFKIDKLMVVFDIVKIFQKGYLAINISLQPLVSKRKTESTDPVPVLLTNAAEKLRFFDEMELLGSGTPRHRLTQMDIEQVAHRLGFRANIEHTFEQGRVDVHLEGYGLKIACEVPFSTKYDEWKKIKKCIDAGYDFVLSVSMEVKTLETVKRGVEKNLPSSYYRKIHYINLTDLETNLIRLRDGAESGKDEPVKIIKGWKVKSRINGESQNLQNALNLIS